MATSSIPVDLRNPGQVFACLGLMEAAEILGDPAEGGFFWKDRETHVRFTLTTPGEADPVLTVLRFLTQAEVVALAPYHSGIRDSHKIRTVETKNREFPCPLPAETALPIFLQADGVRVPISHWVDSFGKYNIEKRLFISSGVDNVKFWAGNNSGAKIANLGLSIIKSVSDDIHSISAHPFAFAHPQSSSFRFDWRRDYIPLDVGFSPNDHDKKVRMVGYPLVELLAAIGLQHARPLRLQNLAYRYGAWGARVPTLFARAMLGLSNPGFPIRSFTMHLGWPGKEGQARCIKDALEDTAP
ncbi:type I-U CRISPR-associated protein Cas8c [Rhodospirillum centenum]|uniref:Type I-U CRISPR-associated protein Cas8c n=1 Tax=Rhodospirillum centenum (strain ATCC 51521 / SW) TaxID=414684 RepID=B6ITM1_RHOCS|nr:type I-U CRISPR-associated protein Cas8c [Rhodospirillum centenum]ACI99322.1 conserved hypothetical protein [Rhodospirillum centenum SW]